MPGPPYASFDEAEAALAADPEWGVERLIADGMLSPPSDAPP